MAKKRNHVPALSGDELVAALQALGLLPLNLHAKTALQRIVIEAATPDRNRPQRLGKGPRHRIAASRRQLIARSKRVVDRVGELAGMALDDEAWLDEMERRLDDAATEDSGAAVPDDER